MINVLYSFERNIVSKEREKKKNQHKKRKKKLTPISANISKKTKRKTRKIVKYFGVNEREKKCLSHKIVFFFFVQKLKTFN